MNVGWYLVESMLSLVFSLGLVYLLACRRQDRRDLRDWSQKTAADLPSRTVSVQIGRLEIRPEPDGTLRVTQRPRRWWRET